MKYLDFCTSVRFSAAWRSLKDKSEYGSNISEFNIYQYLVDTVSSIALKNNINYKLCEALAYVHGFAYCKFGQKGWNIIEEYFQENDIKVDIDKLKISIIKQNVKSVRSQPEEKFYDYIDELFSDEAKTIEVKLVKECYYIIKSLQPILNINKAGFYNKTEELFKEIEYDLMNNKLVKHIDINKYISLDEINIDRQISNEDKMDFLTDLIENINYYNEKYLTYPIEERIKYALSYFINYC